MPSARTGFRGGCDYTLCACRGEGERLFAEDLLAGTKRGNCHFLVKQVRGHDRDGIYIGAREQGVIVIGQIELVCGSKGRRHRRVDVAAGNNLEARAVGKADDNLLTPPSQSDNANADHFFNF